jgi:hypothetical protein
MTDFVRRTDGNVVAPGEGVAGRDLSHEEIDAILDDPTTSQEEKMARMEELRERVVHRDDEAYAPLSTRIMDALSMLAQGGHAYADTPLDDEPKR